MGTTNEFERDLEDQAGLKRPGRIDLRVFQNTPDAGDGHPGLQRCLRNWFDIFKNATHNREITPMYIMPENGWTIGVDNVYYLPIEFITFGSNSYESGHSAIVDFKLPEDYVDGQDIIIKLKYLSTSDTVTAYDVRVRRYRDTVDGITGYSIDPLIDTWTNIPSENFYDENLTIIGTNLEGEDGIKLFIKLKGNTVPSNNHLQSIVLVIPVNTRD